MAINPETTTTVKVSELASAGFNTTDLVPHEVGGYLKKGTLQDLATFIGGIISTEGSVAFKAVHITDGQTLPATTTEEFILVGPGTYPNVGGGSPVTTTEALSALVSNGTYWFIGVEIPITASGTWGAIAGELSDQTDLQDALDLKADLVGGKVPSSQLPSYVDDIIEVANYAALPTTGETGKIYVTLDNNKIYRWSGSVYIEIASNSAIWGAITGTLSNQTDLQTALNAKQASLSGTGFVKIAGTTISYDNTTYLSGTVAIANGGTGATTATNALTNLGGTTVGKNIFTSTNPSPITTAYLKVKPDNSVEWLEANNFRIAIGAGTGNGTVTSVEAVGGYGGLTLTGTVTGSGQLTLGGTPEGTWPINVGGSSGSIRTSQANISADYFLTFVDSNNGSPTAEVLYTNSTIKVNATTGALTAGSFIKSGGTSSQYLMADGSVSTGGGISGSGTTNYLPKFTGSTALGNSLIYDNGTNVGIGTNAPPTRISIKPASSGGNNSSTQLISLQDDRSDRYSSINVVRGAGSFDIGMSFSTVYETAGSASIIERFRINPNGNVGIGTTSPASIVPGTNLTINGTTSGYASLFIQYNNVDKAFFSATPADLLIGAAGASTNMAFYANGSERMRITSGGNVLIGTSSSIGSGIFQVKTSSANNVAHFQNGTSDAGYGLVFLNVAGSAVGSIGWTNVMTSYNTSSDYRLKQDLKPINGLDLVSQIKVYDYEWKSDETRAYGVLAHELQEVIPQAVNGEKDAEQMQGVDYSKLVPILVQAIQEQQKQIEELKTLINK